MDTTPDTKWSLPEPTVSEEGTFCDSVNDTISRLDHNPNGPGLKNTLAPENAQIRALSANNACSTESRDYVFNHGDRSLLHDNMSDANTALGTPQVDEDASNSKFAYNNHNESVFDDFRYFPNLKPEQASVVKFDPKDPESISHATLKALLVQLTSPEVIDYSLICDFFLTYRTFSDAHTVLNLLLTRLIWSLQYLNSGKPDTEKLGKLVLLRTFVVLRHWILNYFYDDFEGDERLCDLFAFHMNSITSESGLISPEMAFEYKIFCDLKTHWLSQINEFFGRSFLPEAAGSVFNMPLPLACEYIERKLVKSSTEQSIHTNPSFRRSAMLSLYDQKTHHKCMMHDGSRPESSQLPISNLVNQHKTSRISLDDKITDFYSRRREHGRIPVAGSGAGSGPRREPLAPKHNHMNLQDSSVGLKKVASRKVEKAGKSKADASGNGENGETGNGEDENAEKAETSESGLKPGFSTNGRVRLPSSRITTFVPLSPVKKMGCSLKDDLRSPAPHEIDEMGRKKSIKRIVEGWTRSLYSPDMRSDRSVFSQSSQGSPRVHDSPLLPSSASDDDSYAGQPIRPIGDRVDVLSARIIDELEFVIRYYILDSHQTISETEVHEEVSRATIAFSPKKSLAEILLPSPTKEASTKMLNLGEASRREKRGSVDVRASKWGSPRSPASDSATTNKDMSIHDISELNIEKIDNLFSQTSIGDVSDELGDSFVSHSKRAQALDMHHSRGSRQSSFGRVTSINWNDHGNLFLENSASLCDTSAPPDSRIYNTSDIIGGCKNGDGNGNGDGDENDAENGDFSTKAALGRSVSVAQSGSGDLDSGDLERYGAEVSDLGIAMSPQIPQGTAGNAFPDFGRDSLRHNSFKHESMKSYTSYDSAFSAVSESSRNDRYSAHLKKKTGCYDLRGLAEDGSFVSFFPRLSTSSNISGAPSRTVSTNNNAGRPIRMSMASHISKCSSGAKRTRLSTLCALTELPFNSARDSYASVSTRALLHDESAKGSDLSVSSIFSSAANATRDARDARDAYAKDAKTHESADSGLNANRTSSVAIPGINTHVLRELASIPDESFCSKNPIQLALYKLEGKSSIKRELTMDSLQTPAISEMDQSLVSHRTSGMGREAGDDAHANEAGEFSPGLGVGFAAEKAEGPGSDGHQPDNMNTVETAETAETSAVPEKVEKVENAAPAQDQAPQTPRSKSVITTGDDAFQDTEDILNEINNAVTEDAIGYSSDIEHELRIRPITPIKAKSRSTLLLRQSNNVANALHSSVSPSEGGSPYSLLNPKLVLDGYCLASETLAVRQVMAAGSHVSFISSYDARKIAEHFTIIERDMLQEIDWKELIELKWNKDLTPVNSWLEIIVNDDYYNRNKGVNLAIARFNLMVNWIISEVLLTPSEDERREIISRFIHIAYHSYEMQNFSLLMQVVLALTSEKVHNLKSTWKDLSPGDILTLKHLEQVTSPLKNFINMRVSTNQIRPSKGCIPFVGLYLSDLIFNAERPKFVKTKKEVSKNTTTTTTNEDTCEVSVTQGDSTMASGYGESEKMINFSRFRTSVHIVKSLSQSIEWSQNYDVDVDDELLSKCLYIKSLDEGEMNYCVEQLKAQV